LGKLHLDRPKLEELDRILVVVDRKTCHWPPRFLGASDIPLEYQQYK
jgi:hypothetical protein